MQFYGQEKNFQKKKRVKKPFLGPIDKPIYILGQYTKLKQEFSCKQILQGYLKQYNSVYNSGDWNSQYFNTHSRCGWNNNSTRFIQFCEGCYRKLPEDLQRGLSSYDYE